MPDALNYRVGPQPGGPLYVPDVLNNREGPQVRELSKCLNGERLKDGIMEKDWPKRSSECQLQEACKKTLIRP